MCCPPRCGHRGAGSAGAARRCRRPCWALPPPSPFLSAPLGLPSDPPACSRPFLAAGSVSWPRSRTCWSPVPCRGRSGGVCSAVAWAAVRVSGFGLRTLVLPTRVKDVGQQRGHRASPPVRADGSGHHRDGTDGFRPKSQRTAARTASLRAHAPGLGRPHSAAPVRAGSQRSPPNVTESLPLRPSPSSR